MRPHRGGIMPFMPIPVAALRRVIVDGPGPLVWMSLCGITSLFVT